MNERVDQTNEIIGERLLYLADKASIKAKSIGVTELIRSGEPASIEKARRLLRSKARLLQFIDQQYKQLDLLTRPIEDNTIAQDLEVTEVRIEELPPISVLEEPVIVVQETHQAEPTNIIRREIPVFEEFTPRQLVLRGELGRAFTSIVNDIPEIVLNDIVDLLSGDIQIARGEFADLAQTVLDFKNGQVVVPSIEEFLNASKEITKIEIAKRALQGFIASSIIESLEKVGQIGMARKLAQHVNRLTLFLGAQDGKRYIAQALAELPTSQRTLLYKTMSTNLKVELDYPDLYECDEYQMARYLKQVATSRKPTTEAEYRHDKEQMMIRLPVTPEQLERLGTLLSAIVDRAGVHFTPSRVIDFLSREASPKIFSRLIDIATIGEDLDNLYILFQESTSTEILAKRIQRIIDGEEEERFNPGFID